MTVEENLATYDWPGGRGLIPLSAEVKTQINDGIPETLLFLSGGGTAFSLQFPHGLVIAEDDSKASLSLINRMLPKNRLNFYLFQAGTFLPDVNETTARGYRKGLEKRFEGSIEVEEHQDLIPDNTFSIHGQPWGRIRYSIQNSEERTEFTEFLVPLEEKILVLRLEGMDSFVETLEPRVVRMLSTLELEN